MKKQLLLIVILLPLCWVIYGQNLIRVNSATSADADYTSLQEAHDNASEGDTIYVEGSAIQYEGADISKRLTIIGPGYFLSENDSTQASGLEAVFNGDINFNAGSEGSKISGCNVSLEYINIWVDDIHVIRCNVSRLRLEGEIENILLLQNYVSQIETGFGGKIYNSVISNNIVKYWINISIDSGPLQIMHNVAMADVFADYEGSLDFSTDGKWQLKDGSPAIGAGMDGVDCGAFGGITPYILSGILRADELSERIGYRAGKLGFPQLQLRGESIFLLPSGRGCADCFQGAIDESIQFFVGIPDKAQDLLPAGALDRT